MIAILEYQRGGLACFVMVKAECPEKNHCKLVQNMQKSVDITKHRCRDIGLPDVMRVTKRQAAHRGWVNGNYPFGRFYGLPKLRLFQNDKEYPSPTFTETPETPLQRTDQLHSMQRKLSLNLCKIAPDRQAFDVSKLEKETAQARLSLFMLEFHIVGSHN